MGFEWAAIARPTMCLRPTPLRPARHDAPRRGLSGGARVSGMDLESAVPGCGIGLAMLAVRCSASACDVIPRQFSYVLGLWG